MKRFQSASRIGIAVIISADLARDGDEARAVKVFHWAAVIPTANRPSMIVQWR